jgi:glycolate oxidase subunit GlcD
VSALERELAAIVGSDAVLPGSTARYLVDATEGRNVGGSAAAVVLPRAAGEVVSVVAWCCEHGVAMVPRGGGTGFSGGAVPAEGEVVIALDRLDRVRSFDPALWRIQAEAGVVTATVRRLARENGLHFPPDPGAAEQSQIGGNIATNAGGPHAFKYGVTGAWVTGLEAVVPPGELIEVGGAVRKDVAGYDLKSLLIGSEGTLGVITAAWLRLIPAPEAALPVVGFYDGAESGCAAIARVMEAGVPAAALEYLDHGTLVAAGGSFPASVPEEAHFAVLAEADGSEAEAVRVRAELREQLDGAVAIHAPDGAAELAALWRWRDGVSVAVTTARGGKVSEDVAVPVDHLAEAIARTLEIGAAHGLEACSWGHAGDGNLHAPFMIDPGDAAELERAVAAGHDLFEMAVELGGTISGEHGVGTVKAGALERQWAPAAVRLHEEVKRAFDPSNLMNPGKKLAR